MPDYKNSFHEKRRRSGFTGPLENAFWENVRKQKEAGREDWETAIHEAEELTPPLHRAEQTPRQNRIRERAQSGVSIVVPDFEQVLESLDPGGEESLGEVVGKAAGKVAGKVKDGMEAVVKKAPPIPTMAPLLAIKFVAAREDAHLQRKMEAQRERLEKEDAEFENAKLLALYVHHRGRLMEAKHFFQQMYSDDE